MNSTLTFITNILTSRAFYIASTIALLILIIYLTAFFSSSETAFLSINKIEVTTMVKKKVHNATLLLNLKKKMDDLMTLILIGTNFLSTLSSSLATSLIVTLAGDGGVFLSTVIITFFITTFGQIIPKTVASHNAKKVSLHNARVLYILEIVFYPIIKLFSLVTLFASFIAHNLWKTKGDGVTTEEIKTLFDITTKEGVIKTQDNKMLNKVFKFGTLTVRNIMKHRFYIESISLEATKEEVIDKFSTSNLKTLAVYDKDKKFCGTINYKKVLFNYFLSNAPDVAEERGAYIKSIMEDILFIPCTLSPIELLVKFKENKKNIAFALDEQGELAGVISLDNLLKTILGRISVEEDSGESILDNIEFVSQNEFIVKGDVRLEDINEVLKLPLTSKYCTTVAGFLLEKIGHLPRVGEVYRLKKRRGGEDNSSTLNVLFSVEEVALKRIGSIRIKFL